MLYQLELFDKSDLQIKDEVNYYFDYLQTPNKAFGNMPVCPFLKAEIESYKLMVEVWRPNEISLKSLFEKFFSSEYNSALFICMDTDVIKWKDVERDDYQKVLQNFLKSTEYKALCFSPFEERTAAGESTRKKSPYFLINVATRKELHISHNKLLDTKYFENFSEEELKKLKIKKDKK
jgi:hypothetical protein|tara:strand:+ start:120 stop:653 length:534 start_codon:yes stop_codon:yes gene_type:complete